MGQKMPFQKTFNDAQTISTSKETRTNAKTKPGDSTKLIAVTEEKQNGKWIVVKEEEIEAPKISPTGLLGDSFQKSGLLGDSFQKMPFQKTFNDAQTISTSKETRTNAKTKPGDSTKLIAVTEEKQNGKWIVVKEEEIEAPKISPTG